MKNDVVVNTETTSVSVQAVTARDKRLPTQLAEKAAAGSTMTQNVKGKNVLFKLVEVPANKIDMRTMVYLGNERDQTVLDAWAVSDLIDTFRTDGQLKPAYGRDVNGVIEIADGSRRRFTAMETKQPFYVWVGELDEEQMQYLSDIGNQYRPTSAWEKGMRYTRMIKASNQEKTAEHFGIDRKAMMRCVHTAELPKALIQALKSPNELSARRGEALAKVWTKLSDIKQSEVIAFINNWLIPEKQNYDTEQVLELFVVKCGNEQPKDKPEVQKLPLGATMKVKNGTTSFTLPPQVSDASRQKIEAFISETLSKEALDNC
ncbi:ParB/RepB/Spo0J family partition protein [Vibrio cholerae]